MNFKLVQPIGLALSYLSAEQGPYQLSYRSDLHGSHAVLSKNGKAVWTCNSHFAQKHFVEVEPSPKAASNL